MTLRDDILALGPTLYWPLDDLTGAVANDASGHSHPGTYFGPYVLGQYGVYPGTLTAQFAGGGSVTCTGFPQLASASFTVVWFMSVGPNPGGAATPMLQHRSPATNRGWQILGSNVSNQINAWNAAGTLQSGGSITMPVWNRWWHGYAFVYTTGVGFTFYMDDGSANAMAKTDWASVLSTDTFGYVAANEARVQNVAYYDKALLVSQINGLLNYKYVWPFGPMANATWGNNPSGPGGTVVLSPTDPIVVQQQTDVSDIRRAVYGTFPPTTGP